MPYTDEQLANNPAAVGASDKAMAYISRRLGSSLDPAEMEEFHFQDTPERRQFRQAFEQAMDMPVVRHAGGAMSPNQYFDLLVNRWKFPAKSIENARRSLAGLPFDQDDPIALQARDRLLQHLLNTRPGGPSEFAYDTGATPEQVAEYDKKGPLESRYQLTPEGEQAYQAERVYNLLSTFQNGTFAPVWANAMSAGQAVLGGPIAPYFHAAAGDMAGAGDTMKLAAARLANSPQGRQAESLYWWNRGAPDGTAGDSLTGAKYPSLSSTTMEGMTTKMDTTDNALPYYNQQLSERYLYNLDLPTAQAALLQRMRDDLYRTTPRYPSGADRKEMQKLTRELRDFDMMNRGFANAEYPEMVRKYGTVPSAWTAGADYYGNTDPETRQRIARDRGQMATYLSPFGEMMANFPRDLVDASTIATGGSGLLFKGANILQNAADAARLGGRQAAMQAAKGVGKALAGSADNYGREFLEESAQNYPMQAVNNPDVGFFTPMGESIVKDFGGNTVDPNNPAYSDYLKDTYQRRKNLLGSLIDRGTTMYALPDVR